jgi:hypothetical protein
MRSGYYSKTGAILSPHGDGAVATFGHISIMSASARSGPLSPARVGPLGLLAWTTFMWLICTNKMLKV